MEKGTLVLTRSDIQNALSLAEYLPVIEEAHALHAQGKVYAPDLLHADVRNGEFHLKTKATAEPLNSHTTERFLPPSLTGKHNIPTNSTEMEM